MNEIKRMYMAWVIFASRSGLEVLYYPQPFKVVVTRLKRLQQVVKNSAGPEEVANYTIVLRHAADLSGSIRMVHNVWIIFDFNGK